MGTSVDRALVDTNVLVYSLFEDDEHHAAASQLLDKAQNGDLTLCLAPQVLAELYAVITDSRRVTSPYEPAEAIKTIELFLAMPGIVLLSVPPNIVTRWIALLQQHPVKRGEVFDLQLIAVMLGNEVQSVYTFNLSDFARFTHICVLTP